MDNLERYCTTILLFFLFQFSIFAQSTSDTLGRCAIKSIAEVLKKKDSLLVIKPVKNSFFLIIPVIGSQPATGFVYGGVAQYTFKGNGKKDKYSSINLSATYTTKQQLLVNAKNTLLLDDNKIFLSGDWRYYIFSQDNYGLGTDIIPQNEDEFNLDALKEPMKYNYFKFHQTISWKVSTDFYMGMGLHLDGYSNIIDEQLNIANDQLTAHYNYSKKYGFNDKEYYVNGLSLNLVYDSRDNQINANKGWFANLNYRVNPSINKNQAASSVLYTEYRYFKSLSNTNTQHVLSFWAFGQFLISGKLPYLNLPTIGGDQRSRSGKGYTQGLFRGFNLVNVETEYRFPISCNQLFSGTIFANFTSTTDKDRNISLFQYIQPAAGIGFRILLDKATRTNLVLNYGWGRKSKGFYLNAGETF
jgi:outer membrane protein assembly factor BamA